MRNRCSFFYPSLAASGDLSPCGRGHHGVAGEGGLSKIQAALPILFSLGIHGAIASLLMPSFQKIPQSEPCTIAVEWESAFQVISEEGLHLNPISSSRAPLGSVAIQKVTKRLDCAVANAPRNDKRVKPLSRALEEGMVIQKAAKRLDSDVANAPSNDKKVRAPLLISARTPSFQSSQRKAYQPLPKYPWICRKRGQIGCVSLAIQTNEEGHVIRIRLHKSSGHASLDQAALNALKTWVFADGGFQKLVSIAFRLKG